MVRKRWLMVSMLMVAMVVAMGGLRVEPNAELVHIAATGVFQAQAAKGDSPTADDLWLLSRVVSGEAHDEPYLGQVAVAAVILNRVKSPKFPATVSGVVYESDAFECVSNGAMWNLPPGTEHQAAAQAALDGWDPTYGSLYFWNPAKAISPWIWSRNVIITIGRHVFGL
ncbi:MAG TPA: cell wall hydrolase [bacterium]|nr:cell wall hydrolase [bacterium]